MARRVPGGTYLKVEGCKAKNEAPFCVQEGTFLRAGRHVTPYLSLAHFQQTGYLSLNAPTFEAGVAVRNARPAGVRDRRGALGGIVSRH